ncbi:MAG TPA: cation diffusion facilitator family transporter [Chryseolinea sp.]|nr:cation diffusion facilitator family transporter [Chryseolinea sp.]
MKPLHHQSSARKALRVTAVGLVVSALLAVIKGVGGVLGNSYALIADAIESSADIFTSGMMWLGLRWSQRPPDKDHPYGHGKGEALITLGISLVLVAAATLIAVKSIQNIITPHKVPAAYTLIILVVVIATKELLYRVVLKTGRELGSGAVEADAIHHRSDAITSVAAFIGIAIGLIGGPGFEVADDYAAMFASVIIVINAVKIARPAIGELLDEELNPDLNREVAALAAGVEKVAHVERCRIRKMGPFKIADLHIWVDKNLTVEEGHRISHQVKDLIQARHPLFSDVMIHIEPSK